MAADDMYCLIIYVKIFLRVFACFSGMKESVEPVLPVVFVMPVIQVEIMQHSACQQCVLIAVKRQHLINLMTHFGNLLAVLICGYIAMLYIFLHLLYMIIGLDRFEYCLLFVLIVHSCG